MRRSASGRRAGVVGRVGAGLLVAAGEALQVRPALLAGRPRAQLALDRVVALHGVAARVHLLAQLLRTPRAGAPGLGHGELRQSPAPRSGGCASAPGARFHLVVPR